MSEALFDAFPLGNPDLADAVYVEATEPPDDDPGDEGDDSKAERKGKP